MPISCEHLRQVQSPHDSKRGAISKGKFLVDILLENRPCNSLMSLSHAHEGNQLCLNQLLQGMPEAHGRTMMEVVSYECNRFIQYEVGSDERVPCVQQLFVCRLRE